MKITNLHHVTAIASDPQRNLDFYTQVLGLHFIKRTVNFDDPGSYHFYFGDAVGSPGTILTFFPWPNARQGIRGSGEVTATAYAVPAGSLGHWQTHLAAHGVGAETFQRFGQDGLRIADPDGLIVELIEDASVESGTAIQGFHGVTATLAEIEPTARLLRDVMGYDSFQESGDRLRLSSPAGYGRHVDLVHAPETTPGRGGAGVVHHLAFRVPDDATQKTWRERLVKLGYAVSPIMDRCYFHSIYFREPGGVLFEIATDNPGFAIDEPADELGTHLCLPSWMERTREQIETLLPSIQLSTASLK